MMSFSSASWDYNKVVMNCSSSKRRRELADAFGGFFGGHRISLSSQRNFFSSSTSRSILFAGAAAALSFAPRVPRCSSIHRAIAD